MWEYDIDTESESAAAAPRPAISSRRKTPDITLSLASLDDVRSTQHSPLHHEVVDRFSFFRRSSALSPPPLSDSKYKAIALDGSSVYSRSTGGHVPSNASSVSVVDDVPELSRSLFARKPAIRFAEPPSRAYFDHHTSTTQPTPLKRPAKKLIKRHSLHGLKTVASRLHLKPSAAKLDKKIASLEAELEKARAERASISVDRSQITCGNDTEALPNTARHDTEALPNTTRHDTEALPSTTKKRKACDSEEKGAVKKRKDSKSALAVVGPGPGRNQYQQVCSSGSSGDTPEEDVPPVPPIPPRYRRQAARVGAAPVGGRQKGGSEGEEEWKGWDEEVF